MRGAGPKGSFNHHHSRASPWPIRPDSARQPNQKTHLLLAFTSNEPANGDKWAPFAQLARLMASLISTGRRRRDGDEEEEKMGTPGVRRVRAAAPRTFLQFQTGIFSVCAFIYLSFGTNTSNNMCVRASDQNVPT